MNKEKAKIQEADQITFECGFCESSKPVEEMVVLTRFFPLMVACRDCEHQIR
ncbi:hypothetical protein ACFLTZ_06420 [Chloroflexota bacterium]